MRLIDILSNLHGLRALTSLAFRRFLYGYTFSSSASWMQRVCFGWLAWELTQSPFWLGMVAFGEFLPILVISPFIGGVIDRFGKKGIILLFETVPAVALLSLLVIIELDHLTINVLFLTAFVVGTSMAISHPTQLAWYPKLLRERKDIGSAANIYILCLNLARFVGAGLAGSVIALLGISAGLALTALGYLIFVVVLLTIPDKDMVGDENANAQIPAGTLEGIRYTFAHPVIGAMLILIAVTSVGTRGIPDLAPAVTDTMLQMDTEWFSVLIAATGIGSVFAGIWNMVSRDQSLEAAVKHTIGFSLALSFCAAGIAFLQEFWLSVLLFAALGFAITVTAVKSQQVIQSVVDDSLRGRVNTLYFLTFRGGTAFGALWMGTASSAIGLPTTLLIGGFLCLVVWLTYRKSEMSRTEFGATT